MQRAGDLLEQAGAALEGFRRPFHAGAGEQRGEDTVAHGHGRGAAFPRGQLAHSGLAQRHVGHRGHGNRVGEPVSRQPQDLSRGAGACQADEEALVPALLAGGEAVGEVSIDLIGEHRRRNHRAARRAGHLGRGQHRRQHVARVSPARGHEAVVAIQVANHGGIGEGGHVRRGGLSGSQDSRRPVAFDRRRQTPSDAARLRGKGSQRATRGIQYPAPGLVNGVGRQIPVVERAGICA